MSLAAAMGLTLAEAINQTLNNDTTFDDKEALEKWLKEQVEDRNKEVAETKSMAEVDGSNLPQPELTCAERYRECRQEGKCLAECITKFVACLAGEWTNNLPGAGAGGI